MKKGTGSKQKGANFERLVAKKLSIWISNGKRTDLFWRSAMSGGRATIRFKKGENIHQVGDICAVSREGHTLTDVWYIECKAYRDLQLSIFLFGYGNLSKFWRSTCIAAAKHRRQPMLIAKGNGVPILVLTRATVAPVYLATVRHSAVITKLDELMKTKFGA